MAYKIVVLGDTPKLHGDVLSCYFKNPPTLYYDYKFKYTDQNNEPIDIQITDASDMKDYEHLYANAINSATSAIIIYSRHDKLSQEAVINKWFPDAQRYLPTVTGKIYILGVEQSASEKSLVPDQKIEDLIKSIKNAKFFTGDLDKKDTVKEQFKNIFNDITFEDIAINSKKNSFLEGLKRTFFGNKDMQEKNRGVPLKKMN